MDETEFSDRVEQTLEDLELALDRAGIDYESNAGILTVEFDDDSRMIYSRQSASRQLWLATRSGGYHFEWDEAAGDWRGTRDGELLKPFSAGEMLRQGGVELHWD